MVIDPFGRAISYVRVSVTDRCDFRCVYCMAEDMTFLPKAELLTLEELDRLCTAFVDLGVRKIRLTGGEPLVRRNVMWLVEQLGRHVAQRRAGRADAHHQRQPARALRRRSGPGRACAGSTSRSTRWIATASRRSPAGASSTRSWPGSRPPRAPGSQVKINAVALKGVNEDELDRMVAWCGAEGFDLTLIETMPLGEIDGDRTEQYLPLSRGPRAAGRALDAHRHPLPDRRPGALRAGRRRPADGSASSRR